MMLLSEAGTVVNGRLVGADLRFTGVSTDSRNIHPGDLFIALDGVNFKGSDFAATALQAGAVAVLLNQTACVPKPESGSDAGCLLVEDTRIALGQLAACWRRKFDVQVVAITGSNGKTTVKEMLAGILRAASGNAAVLATRGNLNNDIGMPLTLLQLKASHRYAVIEMGMNHPGEIAYLSQLASPEIALINNAGSAHLQGLGSVEAVAQAKGEIFSGLKQGGIAVYNADDVFAALWRTLAGGCHTLDFALEHPAAVTGLLDDNRLALQTPAGNFSVTMPVPGLHNARNALAATTAALALQLPVEFIVEGLEQFSGVAGRLQFKAGRQGVQLIDDTYNANPASMYAAISVLGQRKGRRVLVLGDMGELGDSAAELHAELGRVALRAGIEKLYALGPLSENTVQTFGNRAQHFSSLMDLQQSLEQELDENTTVLIKGSRYMKMERVVKYLESSAVEHPEHLHKEKSCS